MKKWIALLLVALLVLSACAAPVAPAATTSDAAAPAAADAPASSEPVTIKWTVWDYATTPYWQAAADAFHEANPNVTVEIVDISSQEYGDKVNIMLSGGDTTDIITIKDIPGYNGLISRSQIDSLNSYVEAAGIDLSAFAGAAEDLTKDGELYSLPFRSDIWILYYNTDLFDAAGVDYPTNDLSWAQFEELARQMTSGEGADKVYGGHFHTWRSTVQLPTFQDGENTAIASDYTFMKWAYDMVTGMQNDGAIMDYGELKAGSLHYSSVFQNAQVAMLPMGSWFIGTMIAAQNSGNTDVNFDVVKYPHPDGVEPGTTAGTLTSLAINSLSENKDVAFEFINWLSGPEGANLMASLGNLPANRTDEALATYAALPGVPAGASEALTTAAVRLEIPLDPNVSIFEKILNEEHDLIMTNSVSVDEGIANMNSRVAAEVPAP